MFDPKPWFIGLEGVEHSAEVARMLAWAATSGASGIVKPTDLEVRAQPAPTTSVRIAPGGLVIESRYAGADQQSYIGRAPTETALEIPATGSSAGATRYVVVQILDPDYPGGGVIPTNPNEGVYVKPALVSSLSSSRTEIPLARIEQPANTTAITGNMIKDLRSLAFPRFKDIWIPRPTVNSAITGYSHDLRARRTGTNHLRGEQFPDASRGGAFDVDCPAWATRMLVSASWTGVRYSGKSAWGAFYLSFVAPNSVEKWTQDFGFDVLENNTIYKADWNLNDTLPVPRDMRGKTIRFYMKAFLDNAAPVGAVSLDSRSGLNFRVRFLEEAESQVEG